jgi:hypothetical protein
LKIPSFTPQKSLLDAIIAPTNPAGMPQSEETNRFFWMEIQIRGQYTAIPPFVNKKQDKNRDPDQWLFPGPGKRLRPFPQHHFDCPPIGVCKLLVSAIYGRPIAGYDAIKMNPTAPN